MEKIWPDIADWNKMKGEALISGPLFSPHALSSTASNADIRI